MLEGTVQGHLGRKPLWQGHMRGISTYFVAPQARRIGQVLAIGCRCEELVVDIWHRAMLTGNIDIDILGIELQQLGC